MFISLERGDFLQEERLMRKTVFWLVVSVGYWQMAGSVVGSELNNTSCLMYDISYSHNEELSSFCDIGILVGFAGQQFSNAGYNFNPTASDAPHPNNNYLLNVSVQTSDSNGGSRMDNATPVLEPATMCLFGIGLVFLAGSGRRFKKREFGKRKRIKINSPIASHV